MTKIISLIAELIALCLALYYTLKGHGKNMAKIYKVFMHLLAFIFLTPVIVNTVSVMNGGSVIISAIMIAVSILRSYLCLCLTLVSDLGKKKSMLYVNILIAISVILTVGAVVAAPGVLRGGDVSGNATIAGNFTRVCLCLVVQQMVSMKYQDKEARGTI